MYHVHKLCIVCANPAEIVRVLLCIIAREKATEIARGERIEGQSAAEKRVCTGKPHTLR
jgi:hypothetical protein